MTRHLSQHRTHVSTLSLAVVLTLFLLLLAVRVHAQESVEPVEGVSNVAEPELVGAAPVVVSERAAMRAMLDEQRTELRAVRSNYLASVQEGGAPTPALTREQQMELRTHIDNAAGGMRASLENVQRVTRDLAAIMQRLGTERSIYAQPGVDVLREVTDAQSTVQADIGEFTNLASLMLKTDDPATYMEDVRAYAELIAAELELMREAIFEAAELSRANI